MLYDRILKHPGAKAEIQGLLTAARKPLPSDEQKDQSVFADAAQGGYSVLDKVIGAYAPYVPRTKTLIKAWLDKAATYGKKSNGVKYFLKKFREAATSEADEVAALLQWYFKQARDKGEAAALAGAFMRLKGHQQDGSFDDSAIDASFLDAGSTDTVKGEISGPQGIYKDGDTFDVENKRANAMLERTKGMTPIQRYYTIARYIIENHADGADYKHRTALILEDYLRTNLLAYIYQVPPPTPGRLDGIRLTNDVKYANDNSVVPTTAGIYTNVQQAWNQISRAVSPAILETAGQCGVRVRRRQSIRDYLFMRAFASNRQISVGENGTIGQILHEYGHHIEDYGKTSRWLKLQQLLHERSKGLDLRSIFPVSIPGVIGTEELQYAATMPAATYAGGYFGYSAKYYDWGSTELVSTVLEVWNRPDRIVNIALADPDLFMAVLGVLRG
ncbi:hypothetical protein F0L74_21690 [Chitinophaga agrisoli]|uniref:Uncharacterized protein n=1 Tax=Chitinophaga agrisoli TaxID=2607653 RepID=A0A5B2VJS3_9BACT|nr:hypothetical protein [Chitinophaga agrisoli]KAA2238830.1 hypothetical protein F0L74_21690 [Chitinophaga agrisoli]